ncbi:leucine-rich repeat-containing protein 40-like [Sabethes cyaneus]|uniref:leucine-rich repeat-containing protein 40-like n=1 Tax=Sabethes cyaneus TaxID=53552 RepID=UPI00237EE8E7|nr:leucine-rich repeat-containing protein 40-like [Sabethes cyaneus]
MDRSLLLIVCCFLVVGIVVSNNVVINCKSDNRCRLLGQDMAAIANELTKTRSVRDLDLHGNLLQNFDANILMQLNNLQSLNLSYNLLEEDVLTNIHNSQLKSIDVTYNNLSFVTVPPSVEQFLAVRNKLYLITVPSGNRLSKLVLSMNKFENLDNFRSMKLLTDLDLSCNQIRSLDFQTLTTLKSLEYLNLANNYINTISGAPNLPKLKHIDLSNNWLVEVDVNFKAAVNLKTLLLQNNKIVFFSGKTNPSMKEMQLFGNDWHCQNLEKLLNGTRFSYERDQKYCPSSVNVNGLCCSKLEAPMAARLITYRQNKFRALQDSKKQPNANVQCSEVQRGACDGDDELVYTIASSILRESSSLVKSEQDNLKKKLVQQRSLVTRTSQHSEFLQAEINKYGNQLYSLKTLIDSEYQNRDLSGANNFVEKLNSIFAKYEDTNTELKARIREEETENQNKLEEITKLDDEKQTISRKIDQLHAAIDKRNKTVIDYNNRIAVLNNKLG